MKKFLEEEGHVLTDSTKQALLDKATWTLYTESLFLAIVSINFEGSRTDYHKVDASFQDAPGRPPGRPCGRAWAPQGITSLLEARGALDKPEPTTISSSIFNTRQRSCLSEQHLSSCRHLHCSSVELIEVNRKYGFLKRKSSEQPAP